MSQTGFPCVDAFEEAEIDVFLILDELFLFFDVGFDIFEVAGEQELDEVVAMEVGHVAIVPKCL